MMSAAALRFSRRSYLRAASHSSHACANARAPVTTMAHAGVRLLPPRYSPGPTGGYGRAFFLACCFLVGGSIVALNIDRDARRIWRAVTSGAR